MLSDFMQVLNSARDIYTKNYHFSNSKLFSTISLLQKQRLNPGNYSEHEIIMKLFARATGDDVITHAKFQIHFKHRYL
jgi:4-hydroxy-3-methylbut-2-en-1-yl diphosphate synthase IspG/GcpE